MCPHSDFATVNFWALAATASLCMNCGGDKLDFPIAVSRSIEATPPVAFADEELKGEWNKRSIKGSIVDNSWKELEKNRSLIHRGKP